MDNNENVGLPVPAAASQELILREEVRQLLVREAPGNRLGVSRDYFLALVEHQGLTIEQVDTLVVGLRMNTEFELQPSIKKMAELMGLGATVEEVERAYLARETISRELGGHFLVTSSSLWLLIRCKRAFVEGDLDGEEFGLKISEAYKDTGEPNRIRSIRRFIELLISEADRLNVNQLETVVHAIDSSLNPDPEDDQD